MYDLVHENIIRLYNHFEDEDNINLVLEFLTGGSLYDCVIKAKRRLTEVEVVGYMR